MSEENKDKDSLKDNSSTQQIQQDSQQVAQPSNISISQVQQNVQQVLQVSNSVNAQQIQQGAQPQTPQPNYIGKIVISNQQPAKHNEFYVWVNKDEDIDVGSTFLVAEDGKNKIIGLVVDSYSTSTSEDPVSEFYSSNVGDPLASSHVEPRVITIYKVRAVRRDPQIVKPPTSRMRVRFANQQDIDFLNQTIKQQDRVLAGFVYSFTNADDPNSWIPLYYDARYIAGPEGAHVMITGKSGLAAKTTYALFLIFSFLHWAKINNKKVAVVAFNVKQCDLFKIGTILQLQSWSDVENLIGNYFANKPEVASANIGLWRRIRQEFALNSPSELIPRDNAGNPMLYYWTYSQNDACLRYVNNTNLIPNIFSYGIRDLSLEELEEILSGGDYKNLSAAQKDYIDALTKYISNQIGNQNITFQRLLRDASNIDQALHQLDEYIKKKITNKPNNIFTNVQGAGTTYAPSTIRVIARKVANFIDTNKDFGLEIYRQTGMPITDADIHEGINIMQLNFDNEAMQRLIFNNVLKQIQQIQQSPQPFDHVLVFVDELNKFAPKKYDSPIKKSIIDIAARARSLNIGLIGAQQFASLIDEEVYGNASTYVIGNTDDAELKNEEYKKFGDLRSLIPELMQGETIIYQLASYNSPIKVRFPIMLHELQ
ncbi:ATP-binding protein [Acidianus sp. HS-5]|uniref:ATP-binding protein n=1 Tax=Acidianus sp. HS-5 TaxID=2886040 RepID=UPI001F36107B|nr:ATP-binding protein [Acidianus sp. HS-5]BDC18222.1 ATPase [Acidianus sp. HS-5]